MLEEAPKIVELLSDFTTNGITYPKGERAVIVKASRLQVVLLFLDGNTWVLSPAQVKVVKS